MMAEFLPGRVTAAVAMVHFASGLRPAGREVIDVVIVRFLAAHGGRLLLLLMMARLRPNQVHRAEDRVHPDLGHAVLRRREDARDLEHLLLAEPVRIRPPVIMGQLRPVVAVFAEKVPGGRFC